MPVKTKTTTKAKRSKKKKPAVRAATKKARRSKTRAAKKIPKKAAAKTSPAKKTPKHHKLGKRKPARTSVKKVAAKTPKEKTAWRISPEISQSVVDVNIWKKGDLKIEHLKVYRSGWIIVDQLPDMSGYNPDEGVNIFDEFEFEEHQLLDGSEETSFFPKELPSEECERLMALSEAELVDEGWTIESATRFSGPLVVEEV